LVLEIPEDVRPFLQELERRGIAVTQLAVERTPMPEDTYHVWRCRRGDRGCEWEYIGVRAPDVVYAESDHVVCGRLTCTLFREDVLDLAYDRQTRRIHEPTEV
jgi:hypothetical protein